MLRELGGDRAPRETDLDVRRDLEAHLVLADARDGSVDAAGGEDLVPDRELGLHALLSALLAPLRPNDDQPHRGEREDDEEKEDRTAAGVSAGRGRGRCRCDEHQVSTPFRQEVNSPRTIASLAPATRSSKKRRLCRLSSRSPRISCCVTRWRM